MTTTKDWTGNSVSWNKIGGYTAHAIGEREENDYYATDPKAVEKLLAVETFREDIWEPACGEGHLSKKMIELGKDVYSSDLIYRGYLYTSIQDFLEIDFFSEDRDIITNPPYKFAERFIRQALKLTSGKVAMLLRIQFLEGQARQKLYKEFPPKVVYVFSKRVDCAKNGDFKKNVGGAVCYAWFVWEVGYKGETIIKWI